ncbi:MAG TPA: hypothetical protein VGF86_03885 [Candidatus Tumulicola sp.]
MNSSAFRFAGVRIWATVAIATIAGALSDGLAEYAENLGWLGGIARDHAQEAVVPTVAIGLVAAALLTVYVAFARSATLEAASWRFRSFSSKLLDSLGGLCASAGVVVAMEAYETSFGAPLPFSSHSIIVGHGALLLAIFAVISIAIRSLLQALVTVAATACERVARAIAAFLRAHAPVCRAALALPAFTPCAVRLQSAVGISACGLRAPPIL